MRTRPEVNREVAICKLVEVRVRPTVYYHPFVLTSKNIQRICMLHVVSLDVGQKGNLDQTCCYFVFRVIWVVEKSGISNSKDRSRPKNSLFNMLECAPDTLSVVRMIKHDFVKILPRRSNSDSSKICPFAVIFIISMCFFRRTIWRTTEPWLHATCGNRWQICVTRLQTKTA